MKSVYVSDFIDRKDPSNGEGGIAEAIAALQNGDCLYFAKREYRLSRPIEFHDLQDVEIKGEGAAFLNVNYDQRSLEEQNLTFFHFKNCRRMKIGGFSVDYDKPLNLTGTIVAVGGDHIDVELIKEDRYLQGGESLMTVNSFDDEGGIDDRLAHSVPTYYQNEKIDGQTLRIHCPPMASRVGAKMYGSFKMRASPGFYCETSGEMLFHDIRVYAACHFLFYISPSSGSYHFERVVAKVHEGSERLIALNADAIHVAGICGELTLRDCEFVGIGDDGLNVHACSARLLQSDGSHLKVEEAYFRTPLSSSWGQDGDVVRAYQKDTFKILGEGVLLANEGDHLRLDSSIRGIQAGDFLVNMSSLPSVHISHCHFERGRARGVLLRTHDAVVEDSYFGGFALSGVLIAADLSRWFEMIPGQNILLKNNVFERVALADLSAVVGCVAIKVSDDQFLQKVPSNIFSDIKIVGNRFRDCPHQPIYAQAVKGLLVQGNRFERCAPASKELLACPGASISDNTSVDH